MTAAEDNAIDKARCRRCGGRDFAGCEWCQGTGTEPDRFCGLCKKNLGPNGTWCGCFWDRQSVAEIISAGIRVQRGAREADRQRRAVTR